MDVGGENNPNQKENKTHTHSNPLCVCKYQDFTQGNDVKSVLLSLVKAAIGDGYGK